MTQVCLSLAICWTPANAKIYDNRLTTDDHSWIRRSREAPYDVVPSEHSPSYASFLESRRNYRAAFDSVKPKDWLSFSASKKVPTENKNFKKVLSPFYTITDKDSQKYKDMVMKSGVPYCQEIKTRRVKDSMICYKCKNRKNGASYEQCSYNGSQPFTGSAGNIEQSSTGFRNRRSNPSDEGFSGFKDYGRGDNPYRFNDKIFSEGTDDVPAEYKKKNEKCEKVIKDSMMCMVCKDTKSNAKYEQCTYIRQPAEKKYTYTKSSSVKSPRESQKDGEENGERSNGKYFEIKPVKEEYSSSEDKEGKEEYKDSTSNCKKIQKDSKTCTVCKDPKTGGNYERCSYAYEPNDKVYKFSRTKSFGYPASSSKDDDSSESGQDEEKRAKSELEEYKRDYSIPESYYDKSHSSPLTSYFKDDEPGSSYRQAASQNSKLISEDDDDYLSGYEKSKSESEKVAKSIEPSHCKEVQKDSMTCKICKDPKTGSNSEQCSYKYQPSDKSYSYSKSRSIGSPTESNDDKSYDESEKKEERQKLPYEKEGYDYSSDKSSYITDQASKREFPTSDESKSEEMEKSLKSAPKKSDVGFYDAFKKKEEIQKVLREFQKEDRSNCKKLMRDKMTCYQCVDDKGFKKEECAFVTSEEPAEDKIDYREAKEEPTKKIPRSVIENLDDVPIEPEASASGKVYVQRELPPNKSSGNTEASKETEPYEYVEETKPVFDKILGFTLPAYMLTTSEHEEEFDKIMSGGKI